MALTSSSTRPTRRTSLLRLSHPPISGSRPLLDLRLRGCELSFIRRTLCRRVDTSRTLKRLFSPRAGQTVIVKYDAAGAPVGVPLYGAVRSFGAHKPTFEAVAVTYDASASSIAAVVNEDSQDATIPLEYTLIYCPDQGFAPI